MIKFFFFHFVDSSASSLFGTTTKPNIFNNTSTSFNTPVTFGCVSSFGSVTNSVPLLGNSVVGSG